MEKTNASKKRLLAASVAGLLAVSGMALTQVAYADVKCAGVNKCAGTGACGGAGHSCAGKNACKGQGWVKSPSAEQCTTDGGTVAK